MLQLILLLNGPECGVNDRKSLHAYINGGTENYSEVKIKVLIKPMNNPLGVSPSKGNQGTTRGKRIRSTVTLSTELRGRRAKAGDDFRW